MTLRQDYTLQDGNYRILKVLGQGGFGITYLAIQVRLDRKVAIKEFFMKDFCERNEVTSQVTLGTAGSREIVNSCRKKFLIEAKHIALLVHPNIIRIIDVFDENSTSYYVMEYIEGGSLSNKLGTTGLSMSEATRYIFQVAETLEYIHKKNIAHLDIKPSNIMLNGNDEIVLIDFGVSKQYDFSTGEQTSVSPVGCSSGYAPLEQYEPDGVKDFSPQTDIYSLGATYFKLLTGITPLKASKITKDFLQENLKAKGVPTAVISIICKSMEKLKENRFSDVSSFIEGLNSISLHVDDSSDKKDENIANKLYEEGTVVMPSQEEQEEIDIVVKNCIFNYNAGRYDSAFEGFSEYAKMGNATAQYYLGKMYEDRHFRYGNYAKAIEWYRKSAEQGSAEAQCQLGTMYENGLGVSQDYAKAVEWYRKAAEQGDAAAQNNLGCMYFYYHKGFSADYAKAEVWYRKSAEQGNADAQYNLGTKYVKDWDYAKAAEWYRKSAEQGNATAQYNLGVLYEHGEGISLDLTKAVEWYRKSAEQGNATAQYKLGVMYEHGEGISLDLAKAVEWYRKSAEQGDANALYKLGIMYEQGRGVCRDYTKAEEWYRKAVEQGNYEAVEWYRKLAGQGNAAAQYNLGVMYERGSIREYPGANEWYKELAEPDSNLKCYCPYPDYAKAMEWYRKAAEQGHVGAQIWYQRSAKGGNTDAQYELGYMYHNGIGVSKDYAKAAEWYRKAAKGGDMRARKILSSPMFKFKTFITNIFN